MIDLLHALLGGHWPDDALWDDDAVWADLRDVPTLLPSNATPLERALASVLARISDVPVPIADLWSPARCPVALLPWLAWALSVDEWDSGWTEEVQRDVIAASVDIHRHKGTIWAMRRALVVAGLGDAQIIERYGAKFYDGTIARDGSTDRTSPDHWAEYRVVLDRPLSIAQAARARRILQSAAPARCHLKAMDYRQAAHLYADRLTRDGSYSRGIV